MSDTENMISKETHEALLDRAVRDATSTTEQALQRKSEEATELQGQVDDLSTKNEDLAAENERLNRELDDAQVNLKSAQDKVSELERSIEEKDQAAARQEVQSKRVDQVKNLGLFADDYIDQKASVWAEMSDEAWAERLEEWQKLKPEGGSSNGRADGASAMTGTSGDLTRNAEEDHANKKVPARRRVLGLS